MDSGRIAEGAELSTAAVGACDEPADAVGNSGRTGDFILRGLLHLRQGGHVLFVWREAFQTAMRAVHVIQLDDHAPTIPRYEKSITDGIPGMGVLSA